MIDLLDVIKIFGVLIFAVMINYLLALAGEPRALWLMRDILGIIE